MLRLIYRAPGAVQFVPKPWIWAVREIARRVKATRDATFQAKDGDTVVNRTTGMACFGGASLDNEEAYLLGKFMRSMGLTNIEHQARI